MGVSSTSASSEGRRNGRDRHRGVALHRWRCTRSHRTHTGDGARAVVTAQTAFLDVGAARAAPPRFYARVGGRCFRRRWPSGSNGTPAVHGRTIPDAPCARTRSKRVRGTPKTLFRPLGTPRARCGAILGRDIPRGMCPQQGSGPRSRGDRCATLHLRRATCWRRREFRPSTLQKGCSQPDCLSCFFEESIRVLLLVFSPAGQVAGAAPGRRFLAD